MHHPSGEKNIEKKACNYSSRYTLKPNATATCEHQVSDSLLAPLIIGKEEAVCWWGGVVVGGVVVIVW